MSDPQGSCPIYTDCNQLEEWLNTLPWLDCYNTGMNVLKQLNALNHTLLSANKRSQLLALYHPHLIQILDGLGNHLLDACLPLTGDSKLQASLALALHQQLSEGYISIVFSKDFAGNPELSLKERAKTILRAIESLHGLLVFSAQIYEPKDGEFWRKVYRLFEIAEQCGLLDQSSQHGKFIHERFNRLFLFSLCRPQAFRQRDLKQIDLFLQCFAGQAEIRQQLQTNNRKAYFFFDLFEPTAPRSIKFIEHPEFDSSRFLYCQDVVKELLAYVTEPHNYSGKTVLPVKACRKIALQAAHALGAPKRRKWNRLQESGECLLVVGLEDLIATLDKENKIHPNLKTLLPPPILRVTDNLINHIDFELLPLDEDENFNPDGVFDEGKSEHDIYQRLVSLIKEPMETQIWERAPIKQTPEDQNHFPGKVVNSSAQGYCLVWLDHSLAKLKVGELLVIYNHNDELEIGTIRWLQKDTDQGLLVGVELLTFAIKVVVVNLKLLPDSKVDQRREWGIIIPPQPTMGRPASLISPAFAWQQGHWVEVHHDDKTVENYWLKTLIESTPAFDLFALEKTT